MLFAVVIQDGFGVFPYFSEQGGVQSNEAVGVVDFVGDAGHQGSEGDHFIRLNQLLPAQFGLAFGCALRRDIHIGDQYAPVGIFVPGDD